MKLAIDPGFLEFLRELSSKEPGKALAHYQESIDFLTVLMGDGDCREHMLGGIIITGTDVLLKMSPKENEDPFAGIKVWGGVQGFLSNYYKTTCGGAYENFKITHNMDEKKIHVAEILALLLEKFPPTEKFTKHEKRIARALKEQNPVVHIPLI